MQSVRGVWALQTSSDRRCTGPQAPPNVTEAGVYKEMVVKRTVLVFVYVSWSEKSLDQVSLVPSLLWLIIQDTGSCIAT